MQGGQGRNRGPVGRLGKGYRACWGGGSVEVRKEVKDLWGGQGWGMGLVVRSGKGWRVCEEVR